MATALSTTRRFRGLALLAVLVAAAAGCDDVPTAPTDTTQRTTIFFVNRMQAGQFAWRTFSIDKTSEVKVQLVSITPQTDAVVSFGYGPFTTGDCQPANVIETAPLATPQFTATLDPGNYCVRVADIGNLTRDWNFQIIIEITN